MLTRRIAGAVAAVLLLTALLAACEPARLALRPAQTPSVAGVPTPLGAPPQGLPASLPGLLARVGSAALEWQNAPRLAEVAITLDRGSWQSARTLWVAPGSDRFLVVQADAGGLREERTTLSTLDLTVIPDEGVDQIPPFPEATRTPVDLAAAAAQCELGERIEVRFATGAPYAWDGTEWAAPPAWTVVLSPAPESTEATTPAGATTPQDPSAAGPSAAAPRFATADPVSGAAVCSG